LDSGKDAEHDRWIDDVAGYDLGCHLLRLLSFDSTPRSLTALCLHSLVEGYPELDSRACAGIALDATSAPGQLGPFADRNETEMPRHVRGLRDDEAHAVVDDDHADSTVGSVSRHVDRRRMR